MKIKISLHQNNLCQVCNKILFDIINLKRYWSIFPEGFVKHHISYFPEKIIYVHTSCHHKIHRTNEHPNLKPKIEDSAKFYNRELDIKKRRYK